MCSIGINSDCTLLISGSWDVRGIKIWDTLSQKQIAVLNIPFVCSIAFSPDNLLIAFNSDNKILIYTNFRNIQSGHKTKPARC